MYMEEAVSIIKTDDGGYVVKVRVVRKKDREDKDEVHCGRTREKSLIAKDINEVKALLDKALPDMKPGGMEEDEFVAAFKDMVKED